VSFLAIALASFDAALDAEAPDSFLATALASLRTFKLAARLLCDATFRLLPRLD
jgi:hypothetical protein